MLGATTKFSRSTTQKHNDTYKPADKKKLTQKYAMTRKPVAKRKRRDSTSEEESTSGYDVDSVDDGADEDSEEDADDEDDIPAVKAPSRSRELNAAGRKYKKAVRDDASLADSESMFGDFDEALDHDEDPNLSPEENRKRFEQKIFAESDDDNDVYQAVDEISDSDDDNLNNDFIEQQDFFAMFPDAQLSDTDFVNQIDGMTDCGFGNESDSSFNHGPSSPEDTKDVDATPVRHVHFAAEAAPSSSLRMSASPTITRALLPSALPNTEDAVQSGLILDELDDCMSHSAPLFPTYTD
jgi:hypothetical protein